MDYRTCSRCKANSQKPIAEAVRATITRDEQTALATRNSVDPEAYVLYLRGGHFVNLRSPESVRRGIEYYQQALALDPTQVDALVALTQADMFGDRNLRGAQRGLERILHLYPNDATAHGWHGTLLTETGLLEEALAERRRALALDPLSNSTNNSLGGADANGPVRGSRDGVQERARNRSRLRGRARLVGFRLSQDGPARRGYCGTGGLRAALP